MFNYYYCSVILFVYLGSYTAVGDEWFSLFDMWLSHGTYFGICYIDRRIIDGCFHLDYVINAYSDYRSTGIRVYQIPMYLSRQDFQTSSDEAKKNFTVLEIWGDFTGDLTQMSKESAALKNFGVKSEIIIEGINGNSNQYIKDNINKFMIRPATECTAASTVDSTTSSITTVSTTTTQPPLNTSPLPIYGLDSNNTLLISIIAILGIVVMTLVFILAVMLARRDSYSLTNDQRGNIVGTSSREAMPSEARYSTKDGDEVVIHCHETKQQNDHKETEKSKDAEEVIVGTL